MTVEVIQYTVTSWAIHGSDIPVGTVKIRMDGPRDEHVSIRILAPEPEYKPNTFVYPPLMPRDHFARPGESHNDGRCRLAQLLRERFHRAYPGKEPGLLYVVLTDADGPRFGLTALHAAPEVLMSGVQVIRWLSANDPIEVLGGTLEGNSNEP